MARILVLVIPFPEQNVVVKFNNKEVESFNNLLADDVVSQSILLQARAGSNRLSFTYLDWNGRLTTLDTDNRPIALKFTLLQLLTQPLF